MERGALSLQRDALSREACLLHCYNIAMYYFVGADNVRFKHPAVPGDTVYLESHVVTKKKGIWKFDCSASIEDKLIAEATILCADRPK